MTLQTRRTLTVGFFVATLMAMGVGPAQAVTSAGPYYAEPSWDQQLDCTTMATCPRFIVLSNWADTSHPSGGAAVLDRETGLVWERRPNGGFFSWSNAQKWCNQLKLGNRMGWHLPTIQELASLVDPSQSNPALPAGNPFIDVNSSDYWSATTVATDTSFAWFVYFGVSAAMDHVFSNRDKTDSTHNFVWCVRGGQGVDPQ